MQQQQAADAVQHSATGSQAVKGRKCSTVLRAHEQSKAASAALCSGLTSSQRLQVLQFSLSSVLSEACQGHVVDNLFDKLASWN